MKKTIKITIACGMILALGACSSAPEGDPSAEPAADGTTPPAADAGTDAVPAAGAENAANPPPPPADGSAPVDPAAAPPPAADAAVAAVSSDTPAATPPPPADGATSAPTPSGSTAQADNVTPPSPAGSGGSEDYKVQVGDTLMKIAFETYGDLYRWKSILEANKDKIKDPNHIPANMTIKLDKPASTASVDKNGEKYLIKSGDTLGTISKEVYGTQKKWKTIWENNKQLIHNPNKIFAGFYLYYQPDANSPKPGDAPTTQPAPMADAGQPPAAAAAPAVAAAAPGTNTASNVGDTARAPASADMPPPPAPDAPPPTATQ